MEKKSLQHQREVEGNTAACKTLQGMELCGWPRRVTRYSVTFEIYGPSEVLRASEAVDFRLMLQNRTVYAGRAVVRSLIDTGTCVVCECILEEACWRDGWIELSRGSDGSSSEAFDCFAREWQKFYRVLPEFKIVVVDTLNFLDSLRLWLDQIEVGIRSSPEHDRCDLEREVARCTGQRITEALTEMFERFEAVAVGLEPESAAAHATFAKRLLHPLLLCSPFLHRTYHKPLGYAGDYEMVNMMARDPLEGASLFAKIVNLWFLQQPPAEAHRNRIDYLTTVLKQTALQALSKRKPLRVVNIGCGPALEVQNFLREQIHADQAHLTLLDSNQETINHARQVLEAISGPDQSTPFLKFVKKSVHLILKEHGRVNAAMQDRFDLVYCAGLFDYLEDGVCRRLTEIMYEWLSPGGLLVVTNVHRSNPRRQTMGFIMDWHLFYRDARSLRALRPPSVAEQDCTVKADGTGVNLFMELCKPEHA